MSDNAIQGLQPEILWQRFYEISQVPRPSKKEEKIREHLRNYLKEINIEFKEDKVGNIVAFVPATQGYEDAPTVVLQGHVDMVCEKNKGTEHDFENDPIKLLKDDGWITADGTTLGSDNGIGVAAGLAVITDEDVVHGPLEILMTVDEETGLTGANNLEPGFINGKLLLNLDSEEDGAFYVGCSGGLDTIGNFKIEKENSGSDLKAYTLVVSGLKGGHSGLDIESGRGNAIKILARTLKALENIDYSIAKIEGGSKRNAIPREAETVLLVDPSKKDEVVKIVKDFNTQLMNEYKTQDGGLTIDLKDNDETYNEVFAKSFSEKLINTLLALPHGVIAMSPDIPDLVETSTNLATITKDGEILRVGTSQRSSVESAIKYVAQNVEAIFKLAGAEVKVGDGYPGWKPNLNSQILKTSKSVFENLFNSEPEIKAIHAGLECGILGDKNPGLDMVSFGPTIQGAHSPDERINIETVQKFYDLLKGILKNVAEQKNN